jgi:hypothetical protein
MTFSRIKGFNLIQGEKFMKTKILVLTMCLLSMFFGVQAQDTAGDGKQEIKTITEEKLTAKDYEDMLAKLKKGDTNIDFVKFRLAYTETKDYSPYGGSDLRGKMMKGLGDKNYKDALKAAEEMLKTNYCDLHAHFTAAVSNAELEKEKEAEFHKTVFKGLMDAILVNDGLTAKTGMISIGISEQYFVMSYLGFKQQMKALTREEGSIFDVHTSYNEETKETRKFYFNIDKVFGRF